MSPLAEHLSGREYWLSLEQLAGSPEFLARAGKEFPGYHPLEMVGLSRRRFLHLMGASMALAGLTLSGCRRYPEEKLAPFARRPQGRVPGKTKAFATSMEVSGVSTGLLATSQDGRPIKIEGNPAHPYSRGATDTLAQASVLNLYDPDRGRSPLERTREGVRARDWSSFETFARTHFQALGERGGRGLAVLCEAVSGPTIRDQIQRWRRVFPEAGWYEHEPVDRTTEISGSRRAFGRALRPLYRLDRARVIALFDADLLGAHPARTRHAGDWAQGRRSADSGSMSRLHVLESRFSVTGSVADHRLAIRPGRILPLLRALAHRLGVQGAEPAGELSNRERAAIEELATELGDAGSRSLVAAGGAAPAEAHETAYRIQAKLGSIGETVSFVAEPDPPGEDAGGSIAALSRDLGEGKVDTLLILGGNPAHTAPVDLDLVSQLRSVATTLHLSEHRNETSELCTWHLPRAHYLETWGDGRAWDGTVSLAQPLIYPLFGGRSCAEILALLAGDDLVHGHDLSRRTFEKLLGLKGEVFEKAWRRALHDGLLAESAWEPVAPELRAPVRDRGDAVGDAAGAAKESSGSETFDVVFQPDSKVLDGRFANNAWLQETPDPLTKVTWDNPAALSPQDASRLGIATGDLVELSSGQRSLEIAVYVLPGQPEGVMGLPLGYGRRAGGRIGEGVGFDTYRLRTATHSLHLPGVRIRATGRRYPIATTQDHHPLDPVGRAGFVNRVGEKGQDGKVVHELNLADLVDRAKAGDGHHGHEAHSAPLFDPPHDLTEPHAWGMAIDMNSCIGCNACLVACQAENNIPVVGKDEVARNREMHWLRIDRYFKGDPRGEDSPDVVHQPVMCVHCETAPCEQVCPVAATVHDTEGLNTMVYNRCVGTRYCANNCPYKVRRFNYFDWHSKDPRGDARPWLGMPDSQQLVSVDEVKRMVFNPDVTVRMRGVMEKCTYCVQRIQATKIERRNRGEPLQDGDVVTACQQVCPTRAIVFGDLNDPESRVRKLQESPRAYAVLEELNVRPRTRHLAKVRNRPASEGTS